MGTDDAAIARKRHWICGFEDAEDYLARADSIAPHAPWAQGAHAMGSLLMLREALASDPLFHGGLLTAQSAERFGWRSVCLARDGGRVIHSERVLDALWIRDKLREALRGPANAQEAAILRDTQGFETVEWTDFMERRLAFHARLDQAMANLAQKSPLFGFEHATSPASCSMDRTQSPRELARALGLAAVAALLDAHELSLAAANPDAGAPRSKRLAL